MLKRSKEYADILAKFGLETQSSKLVEIAWLLRSLGEEIFKALDDKLKEVECPIHDSEDPNCGECFRHTTWKQRVEEAKDVLRSAMPYLNFP
ncbi:MAG: hypothetical protein ACXQS8_08745 [Candidatus Helarchaeales archaeon]